MYLKPMIPPEELPILHSPADHCLPVRPKLKLGAHTRLVQRTRSHPNRHRLTQRFRMRP